MRSASGDDGRKLFQHVGHRGPVHKGLGAMNTSDRLPSPQKEGMLGIFHIRKIRRLRPGLNPRTREPEASMLTPRPPKVYSDGALLSGYLSQEISIITCSGVGRGSSVGIANRYRLDGTEIESRWGRYFSPWSIPTLWSTQPPIKWVQGLSR
jgi:hypothetical protein